MTNEELAQKLTIACDRALGEAATITGLKRLTGGASMETWAFEHGPRALILRRSFEASSLEMSAAGLDVEEEANLIARMAGHGVTAPRVHLTLTARDGLGAGFVMDRIEGEALPYKLFKDSAFENALENFVTDCARELAAIHAAPLPDDMPNLQELTPTARLDGLEASYREAGCTNPVFSYALTWLRANLPIDYRTTLVHGDFRMGNLLLHAEGLSAVLDWELAHIGDPAYDLGYLCAPCWRFGRHDRPVGGVGQIDDLLAAYKAESGIQVDPNTLNFWMIFSSLWWGVTCLGMLGTWRNGEVRSLERAVIGTRVSENEIDLLLMLESAAGLDDRPKLSLEADPEPVQTGDTQPEELASALTEWVERHVLPGAEARDLFQARVARNALGIVERKARLGPVYVARQNVRLNALGIDEAGLCKALESGVLTLASDGVLDHLRRVALEHVSVDQPRYVGLAMAKEKWQIDTR